MRVSITLQLDVDTEGWEANYYVSGAAAIRESVKDYVAGAVQECNEDLTVVQYK